MLEGLKNLWWRRRWDRIYQECFPLSTKEATSIVKSEAREVVKSWDAATRAIVNAGLSIADYSNALKIWSDKQHGLEKPYYPFNKQVSDCEKSGNSVNVRVCGIALPPSNHPGFFSNIVPLQDKCFADMSVVFCLKHKCQCSSRVCAKERGVDVPDVGNATVFSNN